MGLLRSEDMSLYEITIPKDYAWDIMNRLGHTETLHFIDLNKDEQAFNLTYAEQIKRAELTLRKIQFIIGECQKTKVEGERPSSAHELELVAQHLLQDKPEHGFFELI